MVKKNFFSLALVIVGLALFIFSCAENNVVGVGDGSDNPFYVVASTAEEDSVDTILINTTVFFVVKTKKNYANFVDSILTVTWKYKDGTVKDENTCDRGLCQGEYKYKKMGKQSAQIIVCMKSGTVYTEDVYIFVKEPLVFTEGDKDSLFKWIKSDSVSGVANTYKVRIGFGDAVMSKIARLKGVSLSIGRKGPTGDDWTGSIIPVTTKTSDDKFYYCDIVLPAGKTYDLKIWCNSSSDVFLTKDEMSGNKFFDQNKEIFSFSLKYNGQVVPKTTDYGTPTTPIDTTNKVVTTDGLPGTNGDSGSNWIMRWSYNSLKDSVFFYFHMKGIVLCATESAWTRSNIGGTENTKTNIAMLGDSVGVWPVSPSQFPSGGLKILSYGRGTCQSEFANSSYKTTDGSALISINIIPID